jgi:DNA repair exonuclease SbcCD ATPase subunit
MSPKPLPKSGSTDGGLDQRQRAIETGFATALDRSMGYLKRIFSSEFASLLRHPPPAPSLDVDDFSSDLSKEISSLIQTPLVSVEVNAPTLTRKVGVAVDDQTKPVTALLAEAKARNDAAADRHIADLRQLQEEVDGLRAVFKSSADGIMRELEKERENAAALRDAEQSRFRELDQKLRAIQLRYAELETKSNHQQSERERLGRVAKKLEHNRRIWEEESMPRMLSEGNVLRDRLIEELHELRKDISQEPFEGLAELIDEGLKAVKEEGNGLRTELTELELANRALLSRWKDAWYGGPDPRISSLSPRRDSVLSQANMRLAELKRQREQSLGVSPPVGQ